MKTIVFNSCLARTTEVDLLHFHDMMFHGVLDDDRLDETGEYVMYRNAYYEPPLATPSQKIVVWPRVSEKLVKAARIKTCPVIDAFVFNVPYKIGEIPEELVGASPWIERSMLARDESLLPKGAAKESYVAIRPSPIKDFARNAWMAVTGREPFTGHIETWDIIGQADLVHEFGMMRVEHGFQVSPAVWEILRPLAQWPYFRSVEFDIGN